MVLEVGAIRGVFMKKIIVMIFLIIPIFTWALDGHEQQQAEEVLINSPVVEATANLLKIFETKSSGSVVGFHTDIANNETITKLIFVDNQNVAYVQDYICQFSKQSPQLAVQCSQKSSSRVISKPKNVLGFGVNEFQLSLNQVIDIFVRKIGSLLHLHHLIMWQHDGVIWTTIEHYTGGKVLSSHFMCHVHNQNFDCHRERVPGPYEP